LNKLVEAGHALAIIHTIMTYFLFTFMFCIPYSTLTESGFTNG